MKSLFDLNSPMMQFLLTLRDFVVLNVLWIIFCIPIITIGASTSALYSVAFKVAEDKDNYVAKQFMKAFRENLRQSIIAELILIIPILLIGFGLFFWASFQSIIGTIISTICIIFLVLLVGTMLYTFPLIARYENTTKQTLKNGLFFCVEYKKYTIIIILLTVLGVTLNVLTAPTAVIMCMFGYAFIAYVNSYLLLKVFKKFDNPEPETISDTIET